MRDRRRLHEEYLANPVVRIRSGAGHVFLLENSPLTLEPLSSAPTHVSRLIFDDPYEFGRVMVVNDAGTSVSAAADRNVVTRTGLTGERPVEVDIVFTLGLRELAHVTRSNGFVITSTRKSYATDHILWI